MAKYGKYFPRKYYQASDIEEPFEATIERILEERMPDGDLKPVAYLSGHTRAIVLNVTNCQTLELLSKSDDTDNWLGILVRIETEPTRFGGRPAMGIRLKTPQRKRLTAAEKAKAVADEFNDELPGDWVEKETEDA